MEEIGSFLEAVQEPECIYDFILKTKQQSFTVALNLCSTFHHGMGEGPL